MPHIWQHLPLQNDPHDMKRGKPMLCRVWTTRSDTPLHMDTTYISHATYYMTQARHNHSGSKRKQQHRRSRTHRLNSCQTHRSRIREASQPPRSCPVILARHGSCPTVWQPRPTKAPVPGNPSQAQQSRIPQVYTPRHATSSSTTPAIPSNMLTAHTAGAQGELDNGTTET